MMTSQCRRSRIRALRQPRSRPMGAMSRGRFIVFDVETKFLPGRFSKRRRTPRVAIVEGKVYP